MKMTIKACAALVAAFMLAGIRTGNAANLPDFPVRPTLDQAEMLSTKQRDHLDARVQAFMDKTSMQIRLVTVADTTPYPTASAYAEDLYHRWKLGDRSTHNGLLLVIAGSVGTNSYDMRHYCRIMTGWGIVRIIPDDAVISIKHEYMMARLPDQPFLAFDNTLDALFARIDEWHSEHPNDRTVQGPVTNTQEAQTAQTPEQRATPSNESSGGAATYVIIGVFVVIVIIALIVSAILSESSTPTYYASQPTEAASSQPAAAPKKISRTVYSSKPEKKPKKNSSDGGSGCGTTISSCGTSCGGGGGGCGGGGCGGGGCGS